MQRSRLRPLVLIPFAAFIGAGFIWNGERHSSLSAIARTITRVRDLPPSWAEQRHLLDFAR